MTETLYAAEGDSSDQITTETNTTGQWDPILVIEPTDGTGLIFRNNPPVEGKKPGIPIYMDLRDADGNQLPIGTQVALAYKSSTMDSWEIVSVPLKQIASYNKNTISDQQDAEKIDAVKHELKAKQLQIRDVDKAYLLVNSSAAVDHANTEIYPEPAAVNEVDIQ
jgi:hypothetical protein